MTSCLIHDCKNQSVRPRSTEAFEQFGPYYCREHGCATCGYVILADTEDWPLPQCHTHAEHVCFDNAKDERCTICGATVVTKRGKKLADMGVLSSHKVPNWKLVALVICPWLARWLLPDFTYLSWWRRALVRRALRWEVAGFHRWGKVTWRIAQLGVSQELRQALFGYAGRMLVMGD